MPPVARVRRCFDLNDSIESASFPHAPQPGAGTLLLAASKSVTLMRVFPLKPSDFAALELPAIIPAPPLLTTVMPVGEITKI